MTDEQLRALASYVREIMDVVGLPHWKLILHRDRPDDIGPEVDGHCSPVYGQHTAGMWFSPGLPGELPGRQRYVVTHEVMHIFLDAPWNAWADPMRNDGLIAKTTYDAISESGVRAWEMAIDGLARALCPYMPLIDWTATPDEDWIPAAAGIDELHISSAMWRSAGKATPG